MGPRLLKDIILELNEELTGGIVSKVHQPDERNIIFRIFIRGRDIRLIVSAHHRLARMHITNREYPNPPSPLRFCAYLRKRLASARIEEITQTDLERIATITFRKRTEAGGETLRLVCEFTGKSSNIILIDKDDIILEALRHYAPESSVRAVLPGLKLDALPPARELREESIERETGESWNRASDRHYSRLVDEEGFAAQKSVLKKALNEASKKIRRKLKNLEGDKTKAEKEFEFYKTGEILTASFHNIKKGMAEVEAMDYSQDPPAAVKIKLDEKLSPRENVDKYFKRAKKAKVALSLLKKRIPAVEEELEFIESLEYEWETAENIEALADLMEELASGGYLKRVDTIEAKEKDNERAEPVRRYTSSEGFEILCGKSGLGNDLLVTKLASKDDIWFHVKGLPGSHALIKVAGRGQELTKKTIEEAASIAAYYSKAKNAGKVEVIYAEARFVKKPKGAKPGLVTVKEYKSVNVRPAVPAGGEKE